MLPFGLKWSIFLDQIIEYIIKMSTFCTPHTRKWHMYLCVYRVRKEWKRNIKYNYNIRSLYVNMFVPTINHKAKLFAFKIWTGLFFVDVLNSGLILMRLKKNSYFIYNVVF